MHNMGVEEKKTPTAGSDARPRSTSSAVDVSRSPSPRQDHNPSFFRTQPIPIDPGTKKSKRLSAEVLPSDYIADIEMIGLNDFIAAGMLRGKKLVLPQSDGPDYHDQQHTIATVNLCNALAKKHGAVEAVVIYAWELRAYNKFAHFDNLDPQSQGGRKKAFETIRGEAHQESEERYSAFERYFNKISAGHQVLYWKALREYHTFRKHKEYLDSLFDTDKGFKEAVNRTVGKRFTEYLERIKKKDNPDNRKEEILQLYRQYVIEECAAILVMGDKYTDAVLLYPMPPNEAIEYLGKQVIDLKTLPYITIRHVKKEPERVSVHGTFGRSDSTDSESDLTDSGSSQSRTPPKESNPLSEETYLKNGVKEKVLTMLAEYLKFIDRIPEEISDEVYQQAQTLQTGISRGKDFTTVFAAYGAHVDYLRILFEKKPHLNGVLKSLDEQVKAIGIKVMEFESRRAPQPSKLEMLEDTDTIKTARSASSPRLLRPARTEENDAEAKSQYSQQASPISTLSS